MDYIGSKTKLNDWIFEVLSNYLDKKEWSNSTFIDACAGSCSVSKYALRNGFKVISNDLFEFSSAIISGYSSLDLSNDIEAYEKISSHINYINSIIGKKGFFFKNYSVSSGRFYFSDINAMKIDAAREYIDSIEDKRIRDYLLYISIEGMSSVMNTAGVQAAFLKNMKDRAKKEFFIKFQPSQKGDIVATNGDLRKVASISSDVLYIDPPYNSRQYGPNYHLYETFIKNDNPFIQGIAGLRDWKKESKSDFCSRKTCSNIFKDIINLSKSNLVLISYSSDGILKKDEMINIFKEFGTANVHEKLQNRYKSDSSKNRVYNNDVLKEFLFVIVK